MRVGDLIIPMESMVFLHQTWGNKSEGRDRRSGTLHRGEYGIILEDTLERGGNGVRILTSGGAVGWCHRYDLDMMSDE